jgi:Flp pilus assembly protein TadG
MRALTVRRRWTWRRRERDERGSATVFVIGFAIVLFLCAGLVIDGGMAINKRMRIADDAEQAARIGADSIDVNYFRTQEVLVVDPGLARSRIAGYMSDLGHPAGQWDADITGNTVRVTVRDTSKTYILSLFKVTFPINAVAEAVPETGQPAAP